MFWFRETFRLVDKHRRFTLGSIYASRIIIRDILMSFAKKRYVAIKILENNVDVKMSNSVSMS
jgi:hypothetical protein